jgi:hypothetical protein
LLRALPFIPSLRDVTGFTWNAWQTTKRRADHLLEQRADPNHHLALERKEMADGTLPRQKTCTKCGVTFPATPDFFYRCKSNIDGLQGGCRACATAVAKALYHTDPIGAAAKKRAARRADPEKIRSYDRARYAADSKPKQMSARRHRAANVEKFREWERARGATNKRKATQAASRKRNAAAIQERVRRWRKNNADRVRGYYRQKWLNDPRHRLRSNITRGINFSLARGVKGKDGRSWQRLLGYTVDDLRTHLERQFARGMSWDNYGKWHVDHIRPVATFNFKTVDDPDFRACWALTNLRPLWRLDNLKKAAAVTLLM